MSRYTRDREPKDGHHPRTNTRPRKAAKDRRCCGGRERKDSREEKKGTEEDGFAIRDTKENASEQESAKDFEATEKRLWEMHRLFNNRTGSLSSTYKKNTEANTKVYDLNLREPSLL